MPNVLKADGTFESYDENKLLSSIKRAGIPGSLHSQVLNHIKSKLYENIPTSEIYKHIEEFFIKENDVYSKTKYSLKRAIMDLGPTGFPFESYVSEILKVLGFQVEVGTYLIGKCVKHEVDVLAKNQNEKIMVECKFHNKSGIKSDLHVSLYTKARFEDLKQKHNFSKAMLVTNTKISLDALSYANCEGIRILSWSYPDGESLRDLIEKYKLYPITQLSFLSLSQKQQLLNQKIVLMKQICEDSSVLNKITLPQDKLEEIEKEAASVCNL
ncbi:MAG: ATP-cone domain-containing protein [Microgenomates group bacterium GW2011_GWA2_37_6]|nr:MAG: ATP-cone domain-containing protein [Microgenomates group bacterium GW2011_GWA2_37_6]